MADIETVVNGLNDIGGFIAGRVGFEQARNFLRTIDDAIDLLKEQETVEHACDILRANGWKETEPLCSECDAVHVVRCKDCKHLGYTNSHWFCKWQNRCVDEDWFCADGERKEGSVKWECHANCVRMR